MRRKGYRSLTLEDQEPDFKGEIRFLPADVQRIREAITATRQTDEGHTLTFAADYRENTPTLTRFSLYGTADSVSFLVDLIHRMKVPVEFASRKGPITWGFLDEDLEYQRLAWNHTNPGAPLDFEEQLARRKQQQLLKLITQ